MDDMQLLDLDPDSLDLIISNASNWELRQMRTIRSNKLRHFVNNEIERRIYKGIKQYQKCDKEYQKCIDSFLTVLNYIFDYDDPDMTILQYIRDNDIQLYTDFLDECLIRSTGDYDLIKFYLDLGADPNYTRNTDTWPNKVRPLRSVISRIEEYITNPELKIKLLISYGAVLSDDDISVLVAVDTRKNIDLEDIITHMFTNIDYAKEEYCDSFMKYAKLYNNGNIINLLIELGC